MLFFLHTVVVVHCPNGLVLHSKVNKGLKQLRKTEGSVLGLSIGLVLPQLLCLVLDLGIVVVLVLLVGVELFLELGGRQRRIDFFYFLLAFRVDQVAVKLYDSIK